MTHNQNSTAPDGRELLERVTALQALSTTIYSMLDDAKRDLHQIMQDGETRKAFSTRGIHLATIPRSKPNPKAKITDPAVVMADAEARGMELADTLPAPGTEEHEQVIELVREHAPHLLGAPRLANPEEEKALADLALTTWKATGTAPIGWKVTPGGAGSISVRLTPEAKALAEQWITDMGILPAAQMMIEGTE